MTGCPESTAHSWLVYAAGQALQDPNASALWIMQDRSIADGRELRPTQAVARHSADLMLLHNWLCCARECPLKSRQANKPVTSDE